MSTDELPDGWSCVKFGDVVRNVNENSRDLAADGLDRVVGLDHLDPGSLRLERWDPFGSLPDGTTFTRKFKPGQVLFGKRRAYQRKVAVPDFEGVCSGDILVFEPADRRIVAEFLPYLVQSDDFFAHALGTSAGSLSPRTKWAELAKYELALPPIEEQQRIATLLETADRASDSNAGLAQSAGGFADAVRHSEIERDYAGPTQTLDSTASIGLGRVYPSDEYCDDGVLLLRPGNISASGRIDWSRGRTHLPRRLAEERGTVHVAAGDIIMNLTAQSLEDGFLGRVCLAGEGDEGILNQRIARLRSVDYDQRYLFHVLQHQRFRRRVESAAKGSKIKHLYERDLVGFPVPTPGLERQAEVVSRVETARRVADAAASAAVSLRLMSRVLREDLITGGDGRVQ